MRHLKTAAFSIIAVFTFVTTEYSQETAASKPDTRTAPTPQTTTKSEKPGPTVSSIKNELSEAFSIIQKNYDGPQKLSPAEVFRSSIDSMLEALDPHSHYYDTEEDKTDKLADNSRSVEIGVSTSEVRDKDGKITGVYVRSISAASPLRRAGLRYGDKIIEIDGESILGTTSSEVGELLDGDQGTALTLVIERRDTARRETFKVKREALYVPTVEDAYIIRPGVGYISMRSGFIVPTAAEFDKALLKLKSKGMQQLIIDIRDNPGGEVGVIINIADNFLYAGQVIYRRVPRIGRGEQYLASGRHKEKAPIVVLVNRGSVSSSEALAGAFQDHDRALIVGENTAGKGIGQNTFEINVPSGGSLHLTTTRAYTPNWRTVQRDYSKTGLYDYILNEYGLRDKGMGFGAEYVDPNRSPRPEAKTDLGRTIYGEGGIDPDVVVKPKPVPAETQHRRGRLGGPIFAFAMELAAGRVKGFENYKLSRGPVYGHDLTKDDYPVGDALIAVFKEYAADKYGVAGALIDAEKVVVASELRYEMALAAFGPVTAKQLLNENDDQLIRGIELLPEAKRLADASAKPPK